MADYLIQESTLDAIADAINAKTGGSTAMTPAQMVTAINSIVVGSGLPAPVYRLKTGEFTLTANESTHIITHNLGDMPQLFFLWCRYFTRDIKDQNVSKTAMYVMAQVDAVANRLNWMVVNKYTTSSGNFVSAVVTDGSLTDSDVTRTTIRARTQSGATFQSEITRNNTTETAQWRWLAINISA